MRFFTQPLLATLVVVMVSTPTSAQTLPPSLNDAATAYDHGCADQSGLLAAGFACGERTQSCGQRTGCRGRADCCGGCRGGRRSGGCFIGTLLGDVKQAVDTAVAGCTPWTDWRTPHSDESAYSYAGSNSVTRATEGVAAETHGMAAGMARVTKERNGVEVVPRDQWPAEYRDAPVPSPPNLTRSAIKRGPYGYATYQTRASAMQLRIADGAADNGPTEQVTAWVADAEEPQQDDVTVVTDLNK